LPDFDAEVWWHDEELGAPLDQSSLNARHNRWLLNTATIEAQSSENAQLYGLVVLRDRAAKADNQDYSEESDFFINGIRDCRNPPGIVQTIEIAHAGSQSKLIRGVSWATHGCWGIVTRSVTSGRINLPG
jgi:hypothetical protein